MDPSAPSSRLARSMLPIFLRPQCLSIRCSSSLLTTPKFQVEHGPSARNRVLRFGSVANTEEYKGKIDAKPKSVSVRVAYELLQAGHRYLDVRTCDEFDAGHPPAAINIPYFHILNGEGMSLKNSKFLEEVSSEFGKEEKIIVGCKTGRRSLMAATDLHASGFTHVTDVAGGYTAWKENGLPTTD
ncbi:hypothetical protein QUC31_000405 [Theobroma cacao]|uniref:Rhodanese/Cell cycle control phosphatase superfamily protein, putative n=1 Tax=Theobroma cacao TaxID=3641 RepID=A0A061FER0_THECC|nr:Rhodanese/Cell cycle control phosphatase superfamily protein, putative [Theobroma cacao]